MVVLPRPFARMCDLASFKVLTSQNPIHHGLEKGRQHQTAAGIPEPRHSATVSSALRVPPPICHCDNASSDGRGRRVERRNVNGECWLSSNALGQAAVVSPISSQLGLANQRDDRVPDRG